MQLTEVTTPRLAKEFLEANVVVNRHNANRFQLNGGDGGTSEYSAGDIWLLPYWMGRYLGVIGDEEEW